MAAILIIIILFFYLIFLNCKLIRSEYFKFSSNFFSTQLNYFNIRDIENRNRKSLLKICRKLKFLSKKFVRKKNVPLKNQHQL